MTIFQRSDYLLWNSLHHIGFDNAGSNRIHADVFRSQFIGKGNRQAIDGEFGCGVGETAGLAGNADHRGSEKNDTLPLATMHSQAALVGLNTPLSFRSISLSKVSSVYSVKGVLLDTSVFFLGLQVFFTKPSRLNANLMSGNGR